MKIGILLCGLAQPRMANKHGYYDQQFRELLMPLGFECKTFAVVANQLPPADDDCDGYLISGSAHNLDEPLPWTQPLLDWIKGMYGAKPMVGVCFGHQAIAKALGGTVEAAKTVYQTGVVEYNRTDGSSDTVAAWHGQQVIELPPIDLEVTASAKHCPYANIVYANKAISFQSHPEFSDTYIADLYDTHKATLDETAHEFYGSNLGRIKVEHDIGREIAEFYWENA
ncbi:MAG TPA: glutamine amidotransferase [Oceanospirillaceae bacterium]|nr:glutamine amidotransferase [Oceanospirillaceae bacterium]